MAIFQDPLGTLTFELSAGWAYDLLYSTLTDFFFIRWDRPEEMLVVHLRRSSAAAGASEEDWIAKIRKEVGEERELFDIEAPNGRAVGADFAPGEGRTQRVAFLRGPHVDIAIEQRNTDLNAPDPWEALSMAIRTAVSGANQEQPGEISPAEFNRTIEAANQAFEKKDYEGVTHALDDAIRIGISAWLASLRSPSGSPEVHASVRVAQAMAHVGRFTGNPFPLRDAASILRRSLCSLESAGKAVVEQAKDLVDELKEALDGIETELIAKEDSEEAHDSTPIISIRERGFRMAQAAAAAFDASDFESASIYARGAVGDFLFLLAYFRRGRSQQIPDEILKHLVDQGISDHEEQRNAIQKAREGVLFPALNLALQILFCCDMEKKDAEAASEDTELYLPLARQILESNPGETSIELNLVLAILDTIGAIAARKDMERLKDVEAYLGEAAGIMDGIGDKKCEDDGWVRNHGQQMGRALQAIKQWQAESRESRENLPGADFEELHPNFEIILDRLQSKIVKSTDAKPGAAEK